MNKHLYIKSKALKRSVRYGFKNLDDLIGRFLEDLVKVLNKRSHLDEFFIRIFLVSFLLSICAHIYWITLVLLMVFIGSVMGYTSVNPKVPKKQVSVPQKQEEDEEEKRLYPESYDDIAYLSSHHHHPKEATHEEAEEIIFSDTDNKKK